MIQCPALGALLLCQGSPSTVRCVLSQGFRMNYRYIFGPVSSGRLGLSLGLDLLGEKICSMDCVYCEVGATKTLTLERKAYVLAQDILDELADWASKGFDTEYVTLGGSGEPCLNTELAEIIAGVRHILPEKKIAVLTNSSVLPDPEVQKALLAADVVLPSMDSLVESEFRRINRPCAKLSATAIAQGISSFRSLFDGQLFLEILLAASYNDSEENLYLLKDFCSQLKADRVDVVTLSRPGSLGAVQPISLEVLENWQTRLGAVNTVCQHTAKQCDIPLAQAVAMVRASLMRRPQTALQLATALGLHRKMLEEILLILEKQGLEKQDQGNDIYYALP